MRCFHCGGNHESDFCPGYSLQSLSKSADNIRDGIGELSKLDGLAVERLSQVSSSVAELGDDLSRSIDDVGAMVSDSLSTAKYDIVDAIEISADAIAAEVRDGTNRVTTAVDRSALVNTIGFVGLGTMVSSVGDRVTEAKDSIEVGFEAVLEGFVGVGAALDYRERMDELRHESKMVLLEEASVAGRARRSIAAASALIRIDPEEAYANVRRAIETFPTAGEAYRIRGTVQSILGKHEEAIKSLRAAVKLSEDGNVLPILRRKQSRSDPLTRRAVVSSTVQLSHELLVVGDSTQAVNMLQSALQSNPSHPDLQFALIKVLARDDRWASSHAQLISELVLSSPRYFNLLFLGRQFPRERRRDLQQVLMEILKVESRRLHYKSGYLDMLSHGRSEWLRLNGGMCHSPRLPFADVMVLLGEASSEAARWQK